MVVVIVILILIMIVIVAYIIIIITTIIIIISVTVIPIIIFSRCFEFPLETRSIFDFSLCSSASCYYCLQQFIHEYDLDT